MSQVVRDSLVATHVDERTRDRLHELARKQDRSLAAVLRIAVEHELERHGDEQEDEA
jgi:predicted transcriptional regulator